MSHGRRRRVSRRADRRDRAHGARDSARAAELRQLASSRRVGAAGSGALGRDAGELAGVRRIGVPVTSDLQRALAAARCRHRLLAARPRRARNLARLPRRAASRCSSAPPAIAPDAGARIRRRRAARSRCSSRQHQSRALTLLLELVRGAAGALPASFDIEIIETHHRDKRDAPSGTALALGPLQCVRARLARQRPPARTGRRRADRLRRARGGDVVGEHTVLFAGSGGAAGSQPSRHRPGDLCPGRPGGRALACAGGRPGRYAMRDVLVG